MARSKKDKVPMLSDTDVNQYYEQFSSSSNTSGPLRRTGRPIVIEMSGAELENLPGPIQTVLGLPGLEKYPSSDGTDQNGNFINYDRRRICNDPYCTTCPTNYNYQEARREKSKAKEKIDPKLHNVICGDAKRWARRLFSLVEPYIPRVMKPQDKIVHLWNKFFVISCLLSIFVDPLFFFLLYVQQNNKCIVIDWPLRTTMVTLRSINDFIYLLHMLLQFRLAYINPESQVVGAGDLIDDPKKIARKYIFGYFPLDLFIVLPLPQIMIVFILPDSLSSGANNAKNLLRTSILIQYIPKLYRFLPFIVGQSTSGFIFESPWANFIINLLTFVLAGHLVGSCWYLFGLQRVNQCLRNACRDSGIEFCKKFIDCGYGNKIEEFSQDPSWSSWISNDYANSCFAQGVFPYGIYTQAVNLTTESSIIKRYIYSLFWGFQQISTLAGNQVPSYFVWEVLFTMGIVGLGLLLFALLIGNMQNFLQSLGRRKLEMSLRRRDVEQWMRHRRLPEKLRSQVRQSERYNWVATRGVNEEELLDKLPEDLQRKIRRHLFSFVQKVRIFALMDEPILDAICERLRQKTYIKGSKIFYRGGTIEKMVFIVRGKMESVGEDRIVVPLSEGDVCGEELLTWSLEHSSIYRDLKKIKNSGQRLISNRTVKCYTNVEAFTLRASDIEEVTNLFSRFLRNPRVQGAIRYESPYCRGEAAARIQVAWRYRKKRLNRTDMTYD